MSAETSPDQEDIREAVDERHVVREPYETEDGMMLGLAIVEVNEGIIAFEHFGYNEDEEIVLAGEPFAMEKENALKSIVPLNEIYERDYKDE